MADFSKLTDAQIKSKKDKLKKIASKTQNPKSKKDFEQKIAELEAELKKRSSKDEKPKEDKPAKKETKKPTRGRKKPEPKKEEKKEDKKPTRGRKKPTAKKEDKKEDKKSSKKVRGVKMLSSRSVSVDGKEMKMNSQEFCDYLLAEFKERRAKAEEKKKKGQKSPTKSVMAKVSNNIGTGVSQAIKESVKSQKKQIEKNPREFFSKVKKLETATKTFLNSLKSVLGSDFKKSEVTSTMSEIQNLVDELKKKVEK